MRERSIRAARHDEDAIIGVAAAAADIAAAARAALLLSSHRYVSMSPLPLTSTPTVA